MTEVHQHDRARLLDAAAPIVEHFPDAIWIPFETRPKDNGRLDKIPALGCRTHDWTTWFTLEAAIDAIERYPALAGIGFAIPDGMIALDYDDCRDPASGRLDFEAQSAVTQCGSYAYATISGRGLRVVGLNNPGAPVRAGKYTMVTLAGQKIEVFVGPTNHFNTLAVDALPGPRALTDISGFTSNLLGERLDEQGKAYTSDELDDLAARIPLQQVCDTLAKLPNPKGPEFGWEFWTRVAAAVHRCTGGSPEGLEAFDAWSAKSWRYCQGETPDDRWERLAQSPMTQINYGTLVYLVRTTPGGDPGFRAAKPRRPVGGFIFADFSAAEAMEPADFVENLLEADTVAMVYGPPGAGKTFLVLDLLLHVAWGRTWFGRAVDQGTTLMFALEGSRRGINCRLAAFRKHHRLDGRKLAFRHTSSAVDLTDDTAVDNLIKAVKAQVRELGAPLRAIAIDTLGAAGIGEENTAEAMNPVLANCTRIKQALDGCCVILVHHPGKEAGRGPRGFSGIGGTADTLIEIQHAGAGKPRRVIVKKQRDLELGEDFYYRLRPVELGKVDRRGKPITSCVVVPITEPAEIAAAEAQIKTAELTAHQRIGLDALRDTLQEHGTAPADGQPTGRVTTDEQWRTTFRSRLQASTPLNTSRMAFNRMRQSLLALSLAATDGTYVWLVEDQR
jgi:KaiC/GvpD/RAD55 family RecA-like ATPase